MKKIIGSEKALNEWQKQGESHIRWLPLPDLLRTRLKSDIEVLDAFYGTERNLEEDLGGYIVIIYGSQDEVKTEYSEILKHHNLNEQDYEYEDILELEHSLTVCIRLFLCSSDYAVETVIIKEEGESKNDRCSKTDLPVRKDRSV